MNVIVFKVKGNKLTRVGGCDPVSGEKNQTKFRFVFDDEDWKGITSATVTQFFDVRYGQNIPFENDKGFGGSLEVSIHDELRGLSGVLWVGLTGYNPKTGATLDCILTAVPVGQGTVVTEIVGTKLYQQLLEFYLNTKKDISEIIEGFKNNMISEDNPVTTELIGDTEVTPEKLDRSYWEKKVIIADYFKDIESLFNAVRCVNDGGSLYVVNINAPVNIGTESLEQITLKGLCYAFGVAFPNGDTIYLSNMTDGSFWKFDRYNEGTELVPVYRIKSHLLDVIRDGSVTPEKLDRKYMERCVTEFGEKITSLAELVEKVGIYINRGGRLGFVSLDIQKSEKDNIVEYGYINGEFMAVGSTRSGCIYLINLANGENWIVGVNSNDTYFASKVDGLELRIETLERGVLRTDVVGEQGAEITLTFEQVDTLNKMFELAAYKDEAVAEVYKGFISAFGLDKYRAMRVLDGSELIEARLSNYWNPATHTGHDWKQANASLDENGNARVDGIPYAYQDRADGNSDRTCYPEFIATESGYEYQVYFEANEGVKVAVDFYNQNVLDAGKRKENWNTADYLDGNGWQDSMGYTWESPADINGLPTKAMRVYFSTNNAGIKKVIVYRRKKVTDYANS